MRKILFIDDNKDITDTVSFILKKQNYNVLIHSTSTNVMEVVASFEPELILLDIKLPGKDGTDICKELKQLYKTPIVLISAQLKHDQVIEDCRADGYMQKPFHLEELLEVIKYHLRYKTDVLYKPF